MPMLFQIQIRQKVAGDGRKDTWEALSRIADRTRALPGCSYCSVLNDPNDVETATLIEEWDSEDAMSRHINSESFRAVLQVLHLVEVWPVSAVRLAMVEELNVWRSAQKDVATAHQTTCCGTRTP